MITKEAFEWLGFGALAITLFYLLALIGAEVYKSIAWKIRIARKYLKGELPHE
jgi:hypothetical protein